MANVIKLRKGLDINLKGKAEQTVVAQIHPQECGLMPCDFPGLVPKVVVKPGDKVLAGDALFADKMDPRVLFASPVSGEVTEVTRGERRKVLSVRVKADKETSYRSFSIPKTDTIDGDAVINILLEAGLFGYVNQLPYAVTTRPDTAPKGIFVSALRDMPLAGDFEYELQGNEEAFQTGLSMLSKIATVYLGIGASQEAKALREARDVELTVFDGPCPAGNVGVQVNNISPVNKGEVVWTVDPTAVIFFGRLFLTGKVDLTRRVAIAGEVNNPSYVEAPVGTPISALLDGFRKEGYYRVINGNPLTGRKSDGDDFLGAHTSEVTVVPEGDKIDELAGWIMPRFKQFSVSRSYFSWLFGKREYTMDTRRKGGERHMIMSGEYDKVFPMDIYPEYLIKSIIAGDIDKQEQLGIYEVAPEDFALAEFVDSSKLELQKIVREGLDILRKENA